MKKTTWKNNIRKASLNAGTYQPYFEPVIDTLAGILEKRDEAMFTFEADENEKLIMELVTARGTTRGKSPYIVLWEDLNKLALSYWRELGLTPAGLKKINDSGLIKPAAKQGNSLLELLEMKKGKENG